MNAPANIISFDEARLSLALRATERMQAKARDLGADLAVAMFDAGLHGTASGMDALVEAHRALETIKSVADRLKALIEKQEPASS